MRAVGNLSTACLLAAVFAAAASANVVWTVGAGANCDAHTIQDAVNLAAASQTTDAKFIEIASDQDYSAQSIHVDHQDLNFFGGPLSCDDLFVGDPPIISGAGASGPVFRITGTSNVTFRFLEIRDGSADSGGGIDFAGTGSLEIADTLIDFNSANYGGGINATASGGTVDVYVDENTLIVRNAAQSS